MGYYRTTPGDPLPPAAAHKRRRRFKWLVFGLLGIVIITVLGFIIQVDRYIRASGHVTSEEYAEVRPPLSGTVVEIMAESGDYVNAGDVLVRLDSSQEEAELHRAKAELRQTKAKAARREIELKEQKREIESSIARLELQLEFQENSLERDRRLSSDGLIAGRRLESIELEKQLTLEKLNSLRQKDEALFERKQEELESEIAGKQEAVERAEKEIENRLVRAPISGEVLRYEFVIGELVRPETVLMEIFGGERQIVKLKVAERFAAIVAPEQPYEIILAPYRGVNEIVFTGEIEKLRNVIQGDGAANFRVAYCSFDSEGRHIPPGTSGNARIRYGRSSLWRFVLGLH